MYFSSQIALKDSEVVVVTRLQNRVKLLEREKRQLSRELDRFSPDTADDTTGFADAEKEILDTIKVRRNTNTPSCCHRKPSSFKPAH